MEKRIFRFGKASNALILPKKWVDKSGLKDDRLFVTENEKGELVISPIERAAKEYNVRINSKFNPRLVGRWIGNLYLYGLSKVRVTSEDRITEAQLGEIEDEIKAECSGFEITSQSNKDVLIEDFTDLREVSIEKVVTRLRYLVRQQIEEAKNKDVRTVRKIEFLVDRFERLGIRYLNIVEPKDAIRYFKALSVLEGMSDDILIISENFKLSERIFDELLKAFDISFHGFEGDLDDIRKVSDIRWKVLGAVKRSVSDKMAAHLVRKIIDGISKISEFGLALK
jgi:hypothetical protein